MNSTKNAQNFTCKFCFPGKGMRQQNTNRWKHHKRKEKAIYIFFSASEKGAPHFHLAAPHHLSNCVCTMRSPT